MWFVFMFVLIHLKEFLFFFCFTFKTLCHKLWIQVFQTAKEVKGGLTTLLEPKKVQVKRLPGARKKLNSKRKKKQMRFFFFLLHWRFGGKRIWFRGGGRAEFSATTEAAARICFGLFAIMDKQPGSQRAGLVEGDAHSCGALNTGAGSLRGERAGGTRRRARSTWSQRACVSSDIWTGHLVAAVFTPPRETRTSFSGGEVRGRGWSRKSSSPEAGAESRSRLRG